MRNKLYNIFSQLESMRTVLSDPVQNLLARDIHQAFQDQLRTAGRKGEFVPEGRKLGDHPTPQDYNEAEQAFWRNPKNGKYIQAAMQMPANYTDLAGTLGKFNTQLAADMANTLKGISTVGDALNAVMGSVTAPIKHMVLDQFTKGSDPEEVMQTAMVQGRLALAGFDADKGKVGRYLVEQMRSGVIGAARADATSGTGLRTVGGTLIDEVNAASPAAEFSNMEVGTVMTEGKMILDGLYSSTGSVFDKKGELMPFSKNRPLGYQEVAVSPADIERLQSTGIANRVTDYNNVKGVINQNWDFNRIPATAYSLLGKHIDATQSNMSRAEFQEKAKYYLENRGMFNNASMLFDALGSVQKQNEDYNPSTTAPYVTHEDLWETLSRVGTKGQHTDFWGKNGWYSSGITTTAKTSSLMIRQGYSPLDINTQVIGNTGETNLDVIRRRIEADPSSQFAKQMMPFLERTANNLLAAIPVKGSGPTPIDEELYEGQRPDYRPQNWQYIKSVGVKGGPNNTVYGQMPASERDYRRPSDQPGPSFLMGMGNVNDSGYDPGKERSVGFHRGRWGYGNNGVGGYDGPSNGQPRDYDEQLGADALIDKTREALRQEWLDEDPNSKLLTVTMKDLLSKGQVRENVNQFGMNSAEYDQHQQAVNQFVGSRGNVIPDMPVSQVFSGVGGLGFAETGRRTNTSAAYLANRWESNYGKGQRFGFFSPSSKEAYINADARFIDQEDWLLMRMSDKEDAAQKAFRFGHTQVGAILHESSHVAFVQLQKFRDDMGNWGELYKKLLTSEGAQTLAPWAFKAGNGMSSFEREQEVFAQMSGLYGYNPEALEEILSKVKNGDEVFGQVRTYMNNMLANHPEAFANTVFEYSPEMKRFTGRSYSVNSRTPAPARDLEMSDDGFFTGSTPMPRDLEMPGPGSTSGNRMQTLSNAYNSIMSSQGGVGDAYQLAGQRHFNALGKMVATRNAGGGADISFENAAGQTLMGAADTSKAFDFAEKAVAMGVEGAGSSRSDEHFVANLRNRVTKALDVIINDYSKQLEEGGQISSADIATHTNRIKSAAFGLTGGIFDQLKETNQPGGLNNQDVSSGVGMVSAGHKTYKPEEVAKIMAGSPQIAADIQSDGGIGAVLAGTPHTYFDENTRQSLTVGQYPQAGSGGRSLYSTLSGIGRGARMLGFAARAISTSFDQQFQEAKSYGNYTAAYSQLAARDSDVGATQYGAFNQMQSAQRFTQRGAYESWGSLMQAPQMLDSVLGNNGMSARVGSVAGVAANVVMGTAEASFGLEMMAGAGTALGATGLASAATGLATALPVAGLAVGGGLLAGAAGMELYNYMFKPDRPLGVGDIPRLGAWGEASAYARWQNLLSGQGIQGLSSAAVAKTLKADNPDLYNWMVPQSSPTADMAQKYGDKISNRYGSNFQDAASVITSLAQYSPDANSAGQTALDMAGKAAKLGMDLPSYSSWAMQMGLDKYGTNTSGAYSYAAGLNPASMSDKATITFQNERQAQIASQFQQYFAEPDAGLEMTNMVGPGGTKFTDSAARAQAGLEATASAKQYGLSKSVTEWAGAMALRRDPATVSAAINAANNSQAHGGNYIGTLDALTNSKASVMQINGAMSIADQAASVGYDYNRVFSTIAGAGLNQQQMGLMSGLATGNISAVSWAANTGQFGVGVDGAFLDRSGNAQYQTNGRRFLDMVSAQAAQGNQGAMAYALGNGFSGFKNADTMSNQIWNGNQKYSEAFLQGGSRAVTVAHNQQQYDYQMASIGIQFQGIALQEQYNWGSGSWNNPSANSSWGIQNSQRALQYSSTQKDFAYQLWSMNTDNACAIAGEKNQYARMTTSQNYNNWSMDFSHSMDLKQRDWTQQDWQYQGQMRDLNYGWSMQDINEQIRYSSGRDRRTLIRHRDQMSQTYGLEGEQIDKTQDRQKESWAAEDERFVKQKEYTKTLNDLDIQSFNLEKSHREVMYKAEMEQYDRKKTEFEQNWALEEQALQLQRKYQYDQLQLQKESAGVAAAAAKDQKDYNDGMQKTSQIYDDTLGSFSEAAKWMGMPQFSAAVSSFTNLALTLNEISPAKIDAIRATIAELLYAP